MIRALLQPGDEIEVPHPCYHSNDKIAAAKGCVVRPWNRRDGDHFAADLDLLESLITSRTRAVVVNFPNNPTGVTLQQAQVDRIVKLCAARDIYLKWPECVSGGRQWLVHRVNSEAFRKFQARTKDDSRGHTPPSTHPRLNPT